MTISETIIISLITALVTALITAYFAYLFGFKQYLKQKRREEIRVYYIEEGLDRIIVAIEEASFNCQFNFGKAARILEYLEKFSEIDKELAKSLILKIFSEMRPVITAPPDALYKLQLITGKGYQPISTWVIETLADYLNFYHFLKYELLGEIELYFRNVEKFKGKEKNFTTELMKRINEVFNQVIVRNEPIKVHLFNLKIRIDELEISSMEDFDKKIPKDQRIKEILDEIERNYKKFKTQDKNAKNAS